MKATFQASHVGLLFLNIGILFCQSFLQSQSNTKNQSASQVYHETAAEGKNTHWLTCPNANQKGHDIVWKKDGRSLYLNRSELSKVPWMFFPIFCVKKTDAGIYTCHNTSKSETEQLLAEIMVNVTGTVYPCGKPDSDLEEIDLMCQTATSRNFPCCRNFPGEPKNVEVLNILNSSYNFCKLYNQSLKEENEIQPWSIKVNWKLSRYDEYRTWGWQVRVVGLGGDTNFQYCVQINNKNKVHWTIPGLIFGATYLITVQPLPGGYGDDLKVVTKKLSIPSWQDMCEKGGRECKWEICWQVRNVTVRMDKKQPVLSWRPSQYHKSGNDYEVIYWSENNLDKGERYVKNKTQLILNKLKQDNCTKYLVKVRAIFINGKKGIYSDEVKFDVPSTPGHAEISAKVSKTSHTKDPRDISNVTQKIIVVCSSVPTALLILVLIVVIRKYFFNEDSSKQPLTPPDEEANEVLIVHYPHCKLCDNVTHSLANVLNETGRIKSTVDMCCTEEITDCGVSWYENKLTSCSKVLVICTKEGKKIYDEGEKHDINDCMSSRAYIFALKMMLGGKFHKNKVIFIPVYFDHSSDEDIMYFMSDRPFYSLPAEIDKLLLSLSDINKRPLDDFKEYDIDHTRKLEQKITELKTAIEIVEKDHNGNGKETLVKFFGRSLSCSCTGEPTSV